MTRGLVQRARYCLKKVGVGKIEMQCHRKPLAYVASALIGILFVAPAVASDVGRDLVHFERCTTSSIVVERAGALSDLMVVDDDHQAWSAVGDLLPPAGRKLEWLLVGDDGALSMMYQDAPLLTLQGQVSDAEFLALSRQFPSLVDPPVVPPAASTSSGRLQSAELSKRAKVGGTGDEVLTTGEIWALVDGCVIVVTIRQSGGTLKQMSELMALVQFVSRPVKSAL